jgi:glucose-1-phosphate thymidylyltransferase
VKGILLAGGSGSRLDPMTRVVSKHLLPVYDKPLIYYPLSTLMLAGIREILVVTRPRDRTAFQELLGYGTELGLSLSYTVQEFPEGIAQALVIGKDFVGDDPVALALGDNIFYGHDLSLTLRRASARSATVRYGATIFATQVRDARQYGVVAFSPSGIPIGLEEKPAEPRSNWAVTGLYFYDQDAPRIAASLKPSARGELEITDVNRAYLEEGRLHVEKLGRGTAWLDSGTPESMLQAASFIQTLEERQGLKVACLEEVSYRMGFIGIGEFDALARARTGPYSDYLKRIVAEES